MANHLTIHFWTSGRRRVVSVFSTRRIVVGLAKYCDHHRVSMHFILDELRQAARRRLSVSHDIRRLSVSGWFGHINTDHLKSVSRRSNRVALFSDAAEFRDVIPNRRISNGIVACLLGTGRDGTVRRRQRQFDGQAVLNVNHPSDCPDVNRTHRPGRIEEV